MTIILIFKTKNQNIKNHFLKPKFSSKKLTDQDIQDILDGSILGIGNDQMGLIKGVDGVSIRNVRKRFLSKKNYEKYHSIERFYSGDYNSYYNDRGDKFLSTWEEKVADFLYQNNIKYHTNVRIGYLGKRYSPDIYLPKNKTFIEIFGMSNIDCYKIKMEEKIKFYNENKIKCLFLFEEDFLEMKKYTELYKEKILNFLKEIQTIKYNNHIGKIYINKNKQK